MYICFPNVEKNCCDYTDTFLLFCLCSLFSAPVPYIWPTFGYNIIRKYVNVMYYGLWVCLEIAYIIVVPTGIFCI